jgi:amino acid transporter
MVLISRSMFAWSFDRLMPSWLSDVDERTHSPIWAVLVVTCLAIASTAVYAFTTWFTTLSVLLGLTVPLFVTAVTGLVLAYRRPALFEASPFSQRLGGIPVLSIVGALSIVGFVCAIVILLIDQGSGTSLAHNPGTVALTVAVWIVAGAIYFASKAIRNQQGIDITLAYVEIPPE